MGLTTMDNGVGVVHTPLTIVCGAVQVVQVGGLFAPFEQAVGAQLLPFHALSEAQIV